MARDSWFPVTTVEETLLDDSLVILILPLPLPLPLLGNLDSKLD